MNQKNVAKLFWHILSNVYQKLNTTFDNKGGQADLDDG